LIVGPGWYELAVASGPAARPVRLTKRQRRALQKVAVRIGAAHGWVRRAEIILRLGKGQRPSAVARGLEVSVQCVRKWRTRWLATRDVQALADGDRPGRPPRIELATKCEVVELACDRPKDVAFREVWTQQSLAEALLARTGKRVSRSTVQRILHARGLRPHRVRQWLHSPDPEFRQRVKRICELYLRPPRGAVVLCIDEKPMQALFRRFPTRTVRENGIVRREFEYVREGTCTLLGAYEIGTGRVFGQVVKKRDARALVGFLETIARRYPDKPVYVVWDNLNIHGDGLDQRWTRFNQRQGNRFHFVYTPKHASWVNQVEIWFSILHRRVLRHGSFEGVPALRSAVLDFIRFWNRAPRPFRWTFTGDFAHASTRAA
jgi:transposase